jgi:hypothetical protein
VLAAATTLPYGRVDEVLDLVGPESAARRPVKRYSLGFAEQPQRDSNPCRHLERVVS